MLIFSFPRSLLSISRVSFHFPNCPLIIPSLYIMHVSAEISLALRSSSVPAATTVANHSSSLSFCRWCPHSSSNFASASQFVTTNHNSKSFSSYNHQRLTFLVYIFIYLFSHLSSFKNLSIFLFFFHLPK